jgi:uncharacterized membrane protein YphA (DoxX/SURF4 family)
MDANVLAQVFACAFFGVCFLQSGFDKALDWEGNRAYIVSHFSGSPFRRFSVLLLAIITVVELLAAIACWFGVVVLVARLDLVWAPSLGMSLACSALLMLFTGQRFNKDYAGAATLATYFAVALLGLYLTSIPSGRSAG